MTEDELARRLESLTERVLKLESQVEQLSRAGAMLTEATIELTDITHDGFKALGISV